MRKSYKDLSYKEMVAERDKLSKELLNIRIKRVLGHVENPVSLRTTRRDIARLNTRIHAIDLGIAKEPVKK